MKHDIFVSYSSKDKVVADAVVAALESQSLRCWYAPRDIKPGTDWGESIIDAINNCKIVLLIFSGNSNQSKRVRDEIFYAIAEEKTLIPFRIENLDPTGAMRLHLSSLHWLDAYHPSWQAHIEQLVSSVAYSMGRAPVQVVVKDEPPAPLQPAVKDESPAPSQPTIKDGLQTAAIGLEKKQGKSVPWLWVGLAVVLTAIISVGGYLWFGNRDGGEKTQPTALSAQVPNPTATSATTDTVPPTVAASTGTVPPMVAPNPGIPYPPNGHSYLFVNQLKTWHEARDYCAAQGGYLATVQDAAENVFIYSLIEVNAWLGATDEVEEGDWVWVSGEPWDYTNWGGPNPDNWNAEEHYLGLGLAAEIAPSQWNDTPDDNLPFVCEWEPSNPVQKNVIVVTSTEDSGEGTLRQALLDAQPGDTITFDPQVFPPGDAGKITLKSVLPLIQQGFLTLDASNAGVLLDGSQAGGDWTPGIEIDSSHNVIKGLLIVGFSGPGILLDPGARFNVIGGEGTIGSDPFAEGNLIIHNSDGIAIWGSDNIIMGNLIGTGDDGTVNLGNRVAGIFLEENASGNTIGPDNAIAFNGTEGDGAGIDIRSIQATANIITANAIYDNQDPGIIYNIDDPAPFTYSTPPAILYFDLNAGIVHGKTCVGCIVEVFSTDTNDGKAYEGLAWTDTYGYFHFTPGRSIPGPYLTATSRFPGENTSEFSLPTSASSDLQVAFETIQQEPPLYQTSFDTWDLDEPEPAYASIENGKLVITSEGEVRNRVYPQNITAGMFAAEFEFTFRGAAPGAHCAFLARDAMSDFTRSMGIYFYENGETSITHYTPAGVFENLALLWYDQTITNTATVILLGDKVAVFINGEIAYIALDPDGSANYAYQSLAAHFKITCEFDNYKLWDLSGMDF